MKIKKIKKVGKRETYDLSIRGNHNYFVGKSEISVHNSGKDPTKVDRSAAYMARYIAIDLLRKELKKSDKHKEVIVKLAYAIGIPEPIQAYAIIKEKQSNSLINTHQINLIGKYDLRPGAIIDKLNLRQPIYEKTAEWGAFGNLELNLPWEIIQD